MSSSQNPIPLYGSIYYTRTILHDANTRHSLTHTQIDADEEKEEEEEEEWGSSVSRSS